MNIRQNIVERCSSIQAYFFNNVEFIKQAGNVDCTATIVDILGRNFIIDTKSLNKRYPNDSAESNEETLFSFKELSTQLLSKVI